jgi:hypothetical protein
MASALSGAAELRKSMDSCFHLPQQLAAELRGRVTWPQPYLHSKTAACRLVEYSSAPFPRLPTIRLSSLALPAGVSRTLRRCSRSLCVYRESRTVAGPAAGKILRPRSFRHRSADDEVARIERPVHDIDVGDQDLRLPTGPIRVVIQIARRRIEQNVVVRVSGAGPRS